MQVCVRDWVRLIGSSTASSGRLHCVVDTGPGLVKLACGLERTIPEVLARHSSNSGPKSSWEGCCRRCVSWYLGPELQFAQRWRLG
jgi:hypothetical protein